MPTPTKIQWIGLPLDNLTTPPAIYHVRLPRPSAAGDTIIIIGTYGSDTDVISSITDDQSNTYVKDKTVSDGTAFQSAVIARASNIAANTRVVTINFSAGTAFLQFSGLLVNNLTSSPVDVSNGQVTSGTSISCGAMTTTVDNDFIVFAAFDDSGGAITAPTTFTAHAGFTLWAPDSLSESSGQYGVKTTAGAITPALTVSRSTASSIALAVAYKTGTAGGAASSNAEVQFIQFVNFNNAKATFSITSYTFNVPCASNINLLDLATDDANGIYTSLSSSPSNTWTSTTPVVSGVTIRHVYATSASTSDTMTLTMGTSIAITASNSFEAIIFGVSNGGAFDVAQSGSGLLSSVPPVTQNNVLTTALTTAEANELILFYAQEEQQSITGITSTVGTALEYFNDLGVYELLDGVRDGGPASVSAASATAYNFNVSWSDYEGGLIVGHWAAQAAAFKTAAAGGPTLWAQGML
jgi:hypothetical protein